MLDTCMVITVAMKTRSELKLGAVKFVYFYFFFFPFSLIIISYEIRYPWFTHSSGLFAKSTAENEKEEFPLNVES